uniref:Uncharacterized protein n=1 Tax=viral metagenome TaxID=1070528 RepID=A0A6M3LMX5_9ZZZZ
MPYRRKGTVIEHFKGGKWSVKQRCGSVEDAKKALRLLNAVKHGWKPTGKK